MSAERYGQAEPEEPSFAALEAEGERIARMRARVRATDG